MARVIVDADVWAYSCGGATQRTLYDWLALDGEVIVDSGVAANRDELNAVRSLLPEGAKLEVSELVEAEPLEHALALCKRSIIAVEEAMEREGVDFDRLELWLTGKGNFREQVATIKGYKANRIGIPKPVHYKAIRRYMRERWGAQVTKGYEADDALSIISYQHSHENVVLCSQDKDLSNVPGRHYNARKRLWRTITKEQAMLHFYRQLVTGDTVDNIMGVWRAGKAKAEKVLYEGLSEMEMYERVRELYTASLEVAGCPYVEMGADAALLENARLLHLLRHEEDVWQPPSTTA